MGESELVFVGMVLMALVLAGLWFFATAMIEFGKNKIKKELKKKEVKKNG